MDVDVDVDVRSPFVLPNPIHVPPVQQHDQIPTTAGDTAECCSARLNGYSARLVCCMRCALLKPASSFIRLDSDREEAMKLH